MSQSRNSPAHSSLVDVKGDAIKTTQVRVNTVRTDGKRHPRTKLHHRANTRGQYPNLNEEGEVDVDRYIECTRASSLIHKVVARTAAQPKQPHLCRVN